MMTNIDLVYFGDGNRQAGTVEDLTMTGHVGSHELRSKMLLVYLTQNFDHSNLSGGFINGHDWFQVSVQLFTLQ